MGYAAYTLPSGKEAGYAIEATCEHEGCKAEIDRGMSYACGGDVGDQGGCSCEGYFCTSHMFFVETLPGTHARTELGEYAQLCHQCVCKLAYLDQIDEAEHYRADPIFKPNSETLAVLKCEESPYI